MFSVFQIALKYFKYYLSASNGKGHGIHSPFTFEFITRILNDKKRYPEYDKAESLRKQLLNDKTMITVQDPGAGSTATKNSSRSITSITRNAAKPAKYGQLLFRMIRHYHSKTILELGTSLGVTTAYLAAAGSEASVTTLEGAPEIAARARQHFASLQLNNITLIEGNFDHTLQSALQQLRSVDFVFIDGNHRKEPTERYFHQLLPYTHNDTVLVFDDIHWSQEMEDAWKMIRSHEKVTCTIDLFFLGIVVFRKEIREKQHFSIRF
jgi:predicted O-methyltransferase YrrM